jgi:Ca2+-dependent lipid-binding protein
MNLGAGDMLMLVPTLAPDPYVKLSLVKGATGGGGSSVASGGGGGTVGGAQVAEFVTRTVYRNKNPTFDEAFYVPLAGLAPDEHTLFATVMDYDALRDKFMGRAEVSQTQPFC